MPVGDQAGGEAEEGLADVVASLPTDPQSSEAVQPGDRGSYWLRLVGVNLCEVPEGP